MNRIVKAICLIVAGVIAFLSGMEYQMRMMKRPPLAGWTNPYKKTENHE